MNLNNNLKNTKRTAANTYLKVDNKTNKKLNTKTKSINNRNNRVEKETYPSKNDFLDVTYSCDYLFQYLYENNCVNEKFLPLFYLLYLWLLSKQQRMKKMYF